MECECGVETGVSREESVTGPCCRQSKSTLWRRPTAGPNKEALVVSDEGIAVATGSDGSDGNDAQTTVTFPKNCEQRRSSEPSWSTRTVWHTPRARQMSTALRGELRSFVLTSWGPCRRVPICPMRSCKRADSAL